MARLALFLLLLIGGCEARVQRASDSPRAHDGSLSSASVPSGATARADSPRTPPRIVRHDVIARGTHGMSARVRWVLSPDRLSMLVVEDPTAVEAEPVPNGVIYASERQGALLHIEDVWDTAPSPEWRWLGYGKALLLRGEHRDAVAAKQWGPVAQRLAELSANGDAASVAVRRRQLERELAQRSFSVSGMAYMYGAASGHVLRLDSLGAGARELTDTLSPTHLAGWRIRWRGRDTLALGHGPIRSQDDAPAPRWDLVRPLGNDSISARIAVVTDTTRFAPLDWSTGPTLDISTAIDLSAARRIDAGGARVESRGGTIYLVRAGEASPVPIGPGLVLAATVNGRYIAAIAPRADRRAYETPTIAVVYEVIPR